MEEITFKIICIVLLFSVLVFLFLSSRDKFGYEEVIRIRWCTYKNAWYKDHVGESFNAQEMISGRECHLVYKVKDGKHKGRFILTEDIIIENN